jgi:hypothetical protein
MCFAGVSSRRVRFEVVGFHPDFLWTRFFVRNKDSWSLLKAKKRNYIGGCRCGHTTYEARHDPPNPESLHVQQYQQLQSATIAKKSSEQVGKETQTFLFAFRLFLFYLSSSC